MIDYDWETGILIDKNEETKFQVSSSPWREGNAQEGLYDAFPYTKNETLDFLYTTTLPEKSGEGTIYRIQERLHVLELWEKGSSFYCM